MEKIKVGILGCTGAVGQKLIALLNNHPKFEISEIAASERSAGKKYKDVVSWKEIDHLPENVKDLIIKNCSDKLDCKIAFSGLDSNVAGEIEENMAKSGYIVVSNSKNHRMESDIPLVIPEVNSSHFDLLKKQMTRWNSGGFIVTNPNCSTVVLASALAPIYKAFGLKKVLVTTMQAISGAGYPGVPSIDIMGNVIPYIQDEEEKVESEILKIFGEYNNSKINFAEFKVSASCNRVPVKDGHTLSVSFETEKNVSKKEIINSITDYGKNSSSEFLVYTDKKDRPQPILDVSKNNGMTVTIGNLRECNVLNWKFTALGHNTIRGAAGAAILNAEWLVENGYVSRSDK